MKIRCGRSLHDVYTKVTADKLGINYEPDWTKAKKGDWFLTSDGKVIECLTRVKYKTGVKPSWLIKTCFGETPTFYREILAKKGKLFRRDFNGKPEFKVDVGVTVMQNTFVHALVNSFIPDVNGIYKAEDIISAYMSAYSDNNPRNALKRALWILSKDSVKERVSVLMKDKFEAIGMNDDFIAQSYKNFIEDADAPHAVRLNALNKVTELSGHTKKEKTIEKTVLALSAEDKKLLIEHRKELSQQRIDDLLDVGSMAEIKNGANNA